MMRFARKFQVGSSILILSNICISLVVFANLTTAAPPPAVSVLSATTSSSTSASGLPVPPSKLPAVPAQGSDGQNKANNQLDSQFTSELQNQALSSPKETGNPTKADNQNDPLKVGENSPLNSINSEGSVNQIGETRNVISGEKVPQSFVDFPPFSKQMLPETRYQRQRRSSIPSLDQSDMASVGPSFRFTRPDEMELRLDDDRDREAFLKLISIITSNKNNNLGGASSNGLLLNDELSSLLNSNTDDVQDDEIGIDLGGGGVDEDSLGFQRPVASPYWTPSLDRSNEPIDLMSSLLAEPPRTSTSSHGRYGLGERPALPLDIGISRRGLSYRDEDDNDGEWMEEAVPLRAAHMKTRRSGPAGNNEFTFNPVKSHFRRYLRAVPLKSGRGLEFMANGGHFGSLVPSRFNRRRRATPAMVTNAFPAVHWM